MFILYFHHNDMMNLN